MKFINVTQIAQQLEISLEDALFIVQTNLRENGIRWHKDNFDGAAATITDYSVNHGGLFLRVDGSYIEGYGSARYYKNEYGTNFVNNIAKFKITGIDIIIEDQVELSGSYTKEQLEEILKGMK